jgi:hypothetical protein
MQPTPQGGSVQDHQQQPAGRGPRRARRHLRGGVGALVVLMLGALIPWPAVASTWRSPASSRSTAPSARSARALWQREAALPGTAAPATPTVTCPASPTVQFSVTDTVGDAFGSGAVRHDITSVSATADATTFCLTVNFAGAIAPADSGSDHAVAGFIDFDTDANPKTGTPGATDSFCPQPPRLGVETTLDLFSVSQGQARMAPGGELVPMSFEESSFTAAIPVSDLGGSTTFNAAMVLGTLAEPTDCAPDGAAFHSPDGSLVFPS